MNGRVVVTAAGVISPLGAGIGNFACGLYSGKSAIAPSPRFPGLCAADLGEFHPQPWLGNRGIRVLDRSARLLAVAAGMALADAGLLEPAAADGDPDVGLVCGTALGPLHSITAFDWSGIEEGPNFVSPMEFPNTVINSPAGQAAIKHKLRGVNSTVCAGFASGLFAIHYAAEFLRFGRARALLAGGVEEICEESVLAFRRTGIAPGEGAALWVLEPEESALARGRRPWLEISGFGCVQDAYRIDGFDPRAGGAAEAMEQAMADAGIATQELACIITSANGNAVGDTVESRALTRVFGPGIGRIPLYAPKAALGEAAGASGALSAIVAGLVLERQALPPKPGTRSADDPIPLPHPISGDYALVNAFGCDGNNASLVIRLWKN